MARSLSIAFALACYSTQSQCCGFVPQDHAFPLSPPRFLRLSKRQVRRLYEHNALTASATGSGRNGCRDAFRCIRTRFLLSPRKFSCFPLLHLAQLNNTKITESPLRNILEINLSLFTARPFFPSARRGISVHISLTFSSTMLQCRSKALTRASSLRLLRQEIRTWVCWRTAVWSKESGPEVNSCCSRRLISYSLNMLLAVRRM